MSFFIRTPAVVLTTAGLLLASMVSADAAITGTTAHHTSAPSSAYAVTVTVRTGRASLSAHGFADTDTHAAELTTQLPGGHLAELRYVGNEAYVHLAATGGIPWLSADPGTLGIPVQMLWAAAATRRLSLKLGPQDDTTVTVTMTPTAAAQAVRAPSGAISLTGDRHVLRLFARHILGFLAGHN